MKIANLKLRLTAKLIDSALYWLVFILLIMFVSGQSTLGGLLDTILYSVSVFIVFQAVYVIVNAYLTARFGGSIGKLASGIKVVDENGGLLSFKMALFRNTVGYSVSALFFGAGYYWIIKDDDNLAWHDLAVGSKVVFEAKNGLVTAIATLAALIVLAAIIMSTSVSNFKKNGFLYMNIVQDAAREVQRTINKIE